MDSLIGIEYHFLSQISDLSITSHGKQDLEKISGNGCLRSDFQTGYLLRK